MSTKIYDAYRVTQSDQLWAVLKEIRQRGRANVVKKLEEVYWQKITWIDPERAEYQKELASSSSTPDVLIRLTVAHDLLRKKFKEKALSPYRDFYDLEVSVAIYAHETGFYLRTFCDHVSCLEGALDFVAEHPLLEDFHYQNQTDPPDDVTPEAWKHRKEVWDGIEENGMLYSSATIQISSWDQWLYLDPYISLCDRYRENPPTIPIREDVLAGVLRKLTAFESVEAAEGLISAMPGNVTVKKEGTQWVTTIGDQTKTHPSLDHAVYHVEYEYQPEHFKRWVERQMKELPRPCPQEGPTCAPAPEEALNGCF